MSEVRTRTLPGGVDDPGTLDVVIVGAGFAGLYMLHRLRGRGFSTRVYEAGSGVGGTWFWNRYPGARCDVESLEYSYSFSDQLQSDWKWTERYASQPEILSYLNHVAERFDLRRSIRFETRVTAATFDEAANRWIIRTDRGERVSARFCIMATGCLSAAKIPEFEGIETFEGKRYHTGHWPHEGVDFTGQTVGVIGTGSSAIQSIPEIARQAKHLFVFQRTPNFSVPAHNGPLSADVIRDWNANLASYRNMERTSAFGFMHEPSTKGALEVAPVERQREYETRWQRGGFHLIGAFTDILLSKDANDTAAAFVRSKIREIVRDPAIAEALMPTSYPIGTKRLCVDTGYFATFNRENVTLIDLRTTPIEAIKPSGVQTSGAEYALDSIVFATGFDAMTGALCNIDIRGRAGIALKQKWSAGPRTYLGLMIAGFPNLFTINGSRQSVGAVQHGRVHRTARGLDRRLPCAPARTSTRADRSDNGCRKHLGRTCQRRRASNLISAGQLVVHGREHPRQAARLHALHWRGRTLPAEMRRGCSQGLRGIYPVGNRVLCMRGQKR
jgi:cation diffusion facilitator CzcD-associated flavoprotein CzcO